MPKVTNGRKGATARDKRTEERRRRQVEEERVEEAEEEEAEEDESQQEISRPGPSSRRETRPRRRRVVMEDTTSEEERNHDVTGYVSNELYDEDSIRSSPRGRRRRSREPERQGRRVPRRRPLVVIEEDSEDDLDEEDLRWNLSRDRARRRRRRNSPTTRRREENPRNNQEEVGVSRTLKRLQRELEELKDASKKEDWKNRSNKIQFQFNSGHLKLLREVLQFHSEGGEEILQDDLVEAVSAGIKKTETRQKHLKIADKYGSKGWRVVEEYQEDPLAIDGDDEKRLKRAVAAVAEQEKEEREEKLRKEGLEVAGV